jgi:electron transport complex protein RnfB
MHSVIDAQCTGCELCVPACPVDCIALDARHGERRHRLGRRGAQAQAEEARGDRCAVRQFRLASARRVENDARLTAQAPRPSWLDVAGRCRRHHRPQAPDAQARRWPRRPSPGRAPSGTPEPDAARRERLRR